MTQLPRYFVLGIWCFSLPCSKLFKYLAWVHDSIGIQKSLDLFHQEKAISMLLLHKLPLSNPNAMLPGCCSTAFDCEIDNLLPCFLNLLPLGLLFRNPKHLQMEVSASCMAEGISF